MDFWVWLQTVGAVFVGALLAGVFAYGFARVWQMDRRDPSNHWGKVPLSVIVAWVLPLLFAAGVVVSLR